MISSRKAPSSFAVTGGRIFDGTRFHDDQALIVDQGRIADIISENTVPAALARVDAGSALVVPGFIDLQVNGGGGVLLNNQPDLEGIRTICAAHARFGTTALLPTLITDHPALRDQVLSLGSQAQTEQIPGYLGLHLEGPHLSLARKGTHDPALIRPMNDDDLAKLIAAADTFGTALITIAPESVTPQQVKALRAAGYHISLGHTDANCAQIGAYVEAGATLVTHLFNAMSQMGNREPGLVGAALSSETLSCGIIADGFHVDPVSMEIALRAKRGSGRIFLVTDAMSSIGTDEIGFMLNGRPVYRQGGRLTLADGTLAGADIDMLSCIRFVHEKLAITLEEALNMASLYPAQSIGCETKGQLAPGKDADFLLVTPQLDLVSTWIAGTCVHSTATHSEARRA
ncbi:N-acetylglucosamine-6-phosphate deacetylase [Agrobacterium vitis]|uniref:N-acetylglucosamine-6-phosphate deacetylase n=1 Tax=Agrobacterium vitis TaxID=373 RepID=A0AAE5AWD4_AGRVI|nr:N-acetylglucosamine-6-phosphate deacetylase [Agrobacterium vitis]MCF1498971.1 N-acetylglucosamine-6-phosphate deacetylase [Allorhizobium sp. Av2]MCM2441123.1 N-acetylglucosamine-6-phosphate deacetylase [Agrobacterium vitis]MUZ58419.1 N-acetylglucosamine-6-phosphate deacetylase [Agrobacterium vitis]MVA65887.1 N-acetylglucosamine-6-phosphate deacetylase [Agrobacterium vitis]MVA88091.1 N-acetylglucosamine-6-phosphate deacetylase [Agrobacterium vitis]